MCSQIVIFGGTMEGRRLAEGFADNNRNIEIVVSVATEYGAKIIPKNEKICIHTGRMTKEDMEKFVSNATVVVDATHPYAVEVTKNIKDACYELGKQYIRLLRDESNVSGDIIAAETVENAVKILQKLSGNILLTTGSKELSKFKVLDGFSKRVFARILPMPQIMEQCIDLGLKGRNLICMQGPFTEDMNISNIKYADAKIIVTKDSGDLGGFKEKLSAAKKCNIKTIVIGRPIEKSGLTFNAVVDKIEDDCKITFKRTLTIVGVGMGGGKKGMTMEAIEAVNGCDGIFGAKRVLDTLCSFEKEMHIAYRPEQIQGFLNGNKKYTNIVVALSGDVGFFSGAMALYDAFKSWDIKSLCGISSLQFFMARLKKPWDNVKNISLHGCENDIIEAALNNEKVFAVLDEKHGAGQICQELTKIGLGESMVYVGERLSYNDEKIWGQKASALCNITTQSLSVIYIENVKTLTKSNKISIGLADSEFIRDSVPIVPITKSEVRGVSISKLRLHKDSIVYDIGAGSGSVSVETALLCSSGKVYAVEKNDIAVELILRNKEKFGILNMEIIKGNAPDVLSELPPPDCVFIGGSTGKMREIIECVIWKNPKARIVVNAITLETLNLTIDVFKENAMKNTEIIQLGVSKARLIGGYNMMTAQNPIFILSGGGEDR